MSQFNGYQIHVDVYICIYIHIYDINMYKHIYSYPYTIILNQKEAVIFWGGERNKEEMKRENCVIIITPK